MANNGQRSQDPALPKGSEGSKQQMSQQPSANKVRPADDTDECHLSDKRHFRHSTIPDDPGEPAKPPR